MCIHLPKVVCILSPGEKGTLHLTDGLLQFLHLLPHLTPNITQGEESYSLELQCHGRLGRGSHTYSPLGAAVLDVLAYDATTT